MDLNHTPSRVLWLFAFYQAAVAAVKAARQRARRRALTVVAAVCSQNLQG